MNSWRTITQAAGTERHADANLAFARHAAGQDECPEIGAGRDEQQQHQGRGGQHNLELLAVAVELENRPRLEILTLPDVVGPALAQAGGEGERLLLRRLRRHPGPETSIQIEGRVPVGEQRAAFDHIRLPDQRHPDVVAGLCRARHHADHPEQLAVHTDASTDDCGIPSEPPLPEQLADDRRRLGIRALIVGSQHAPERGSDAEFGEVVGGGKRHVDWLGTSGVLPAAASLKTAGLRVETPMTFRNDFALAA